MIKIFSATDTVFTTNGNKVLQPIKCDETKVLNDSWTLDVSLPIEYLPYVEQDAIVVATTKYGDEPFRVHNLSVGKKIEFTAKHIGYDTLNYVIDSLTVTSSTASATLTALLGAVGTHPFSSYSDIAGTKTITFSKTTLYDALMTCLAQYGGYLDFDQWQIRLTATLGADRGVVVETGKNLADATVNEDWSEVCTTIFPIGKDGLTLTPKTITGATTYDKPYTKIVNFEVATTTELTTEANAYLTAHALPKVNYKVSSTLQDVYLNDTIQVNATQYTLLSNVLSYTYDVLSERNEVVEFGNYRRTLKQAFSVINDKMAEIDSKVIAVGDISQQQTELINAAGTYGYCTKTENEMYFHDTIPLSSATNVLRINVAGIGFSTTGVAGTYSTAWTIDGKFNADFIQAGTITGREINNGSGTFNVKADGTLTASSGVIAGWSITTGKIYGGDGSTNKVAVMQLPSSTTTWVFAAGGTSHDNYTDCPFRVDKAGKMYATNAVIAGWTVTSTLIYKGSIKLDSANERIYLNTNAYFTTGAGTDDIYIEGNMFPTSSGSSLGKSTNYFGPSYFSGLYPYANGSGTLGSTTLRWGDVWCTDAAFNGSDIRLKKDVTPIDKGVDLILNLKPVQYRWNKKENGRIHYGLIAQETKEVMTQVGINDAGLYADPSKDLNYNIDEDPDAYLALRYTELIAPMIQTIQDLNARIKALEGRE